MMSETDYRYCPFCGNMLLKKERYSFVCEKNNHHYYINPRPTNAVILQNKKGEILLVKRKYPPKKGLWDLPGGFTEPDETMEESVKREIREELGISINRFAYFSSYPNMYLYKGINSFTLMFVYVGTTLVETAISKADEISETTWFPHSKIPYNKIAFPGLGRAIKEYFIFSSLAALLRRPSTAKVRERYSNT